MGGRKLLRSTTGALLLLAPLAGCGRGSGAAESANAPLAVERAPFEVVLLLTGELSAERADSITVPPTRSWTLQIRWLAEDGVGVAAGDRVAELDASQVLEQTESKRSARLEAFDELERAAAEQRARLAEADLELARAESEVERSRLDAGLPEDLLSQRELAERRLALERAQARLEKAHRERESKRVAARSEVGVRELALERAQGELSEAERTLDNLTLRAPAAGIVVIADHPWEGRKLQPGDGVWPGFPLGSLPDLDSLFVVAQLSDVDEGKVRAGMPARCSLDAFPQESVIGRVRSVAAMAQEVDRRSQRRGFRVVIDLERVDRARMRPGMSVRAEVLTERVEDALLVPRAAIDLTTSPARVETPAGNVEVELGPCDAARCVVASGLSAGDLVLPRPRRTEGL